MSQAPQSRVKGVWRVDEHVYVSHTHSDVPSEGLPLPGVVVYHNSFFIGWLRGTALVNIAYPRTLRGEGWSTLAMYAEPDTEKSVPLEDGNHSRCRIEFWQTMERHERFLTLIQNTLRHRIRPLIKQQLHPYVNHELPLPSSIRTIATPSYRHWSPKPSDAWQLWRLTRTAFVEQFALTSFLVYLYRRVTQEDHAEKSVLYTASNEAGYSEFYSALSDSWVFQLKRVDHVGIVLDPDAFHIDVFNALMKQVVGGDGFHFPVYIYCGPFKRLKKVTLQFPPTYRLDLEMIRVAPSARSHGNLGSSWQVTGSSQASTGGQGTASSSTQSVRSSRDTSGAGWGTSIQKESSSGGGWGASSSVNWDASSGWGASSGGGWGASSGGGWGASSSVDWDASSGWGASSGGGWGASSGGGWGASSSDVWPASSSSGWGAPVRDVTSSDLGQGPSSSSGGGVGTSSSTMQDATSSSSGHQGMVWGTPDPQPPSSVPPRLSKNQKRKEKRKEKALMGIPSKQQRDAAFRTEQAEEKQLDQMRDQILREGGLLHRIPMTSPPGSHYSPDQVVPIIAEFQPGESFYSFIARRHRYRQYYLARHADYRTRAEIYDREQRAKKYLLGSHTSVFHWTGGDPGEVIERLPTSKAMRSQYLYDEHPSARLYDGLFDEWDVAPWLNPRPASPPRCDDDYVADLYCFNDPVEGRPGYIPSDLLPPPSATPPPVYHSLSREDPLEEPLPLYHPASALSSSSPLLPARRASPLPSIESVVPIESTTGALRDAVVIPDARVVKPAALAGLEPSFAVQHGRNHVTEPGGNHDMDVDHDTNAGGGQAISDVDGHDAITAIYGSVDKGTGEYTRAPSPGPSSTSLSLASQSHVNEPGSGDHAMDVDRDTDMGGGQTPSDADRQDINTAADGPVNKGKGKQTLTLVHEPLYDSDAGGRQVISNADGQDMSAHVTGSKGKGKGKSLYPDPATVVHVSSDEEGEIADEAEARNLRLAIARSLQSSRQAPDEPGPSSASIEDVHRADERRSSTSDPLDSMDVEPLEPVAVSAVQEPEWYHFMVYHYGLNPETTANIVPPAQSMISSLERAVFAAGFVIPSSTDSATSLAVREAQTAGVSLRQRQRVIEFLAALYTCIPERQYFISPPPNMWALHWESRTATLAGSQRFRIQHTVQDRRLYYLVLPLHGTWATLIVIEDPLVALHILRHPHLHTEGDVIAFLVGHGVPCFAPMAAEIGHPGFALPWRLRRDRPRVALTLPAHRVFYRIDYEQYENHLRSFLAIHPRVVRAASLIGGLIWRIVRQVHPQPMPPMPTAFAHWSEVRFSLSHGLRNFVDDRLETDEELFILGFYSSQNAQTVSWWPPTSVWVSSGLDFGFWSERAENWFVQRRQSYLQTTGSRQPSGYQAWRKQIGHADRRSPILLEVLREHAARILR
ncbi:hypothetical protein PUNSTDRAFT_133868 [Punctularia strigosozonata HHB-11173 SS5]|uniref:uncharacterized protein n=1 Tax=Punctularia strigosozonata (strain HHB-11173) TaxID=741275 RepID=UPI0004416907|nr:uncharacterized protein PUNSTDRAFT_133868 [Punctularia strigosozonata HHB-11173 SS5]EIN10104.1 hypothetical protein PUNSTDRAFT_133868 [Punctularia strigosozonata HHB-11173 SS5]